MDPQSVTVFSGNAHPELAQSIAHHLRVPLGKISVGRFSDGEVKLEIMENIRGRDVFLIQPTCPPGNENLMELLVMADACHRASAVLVSQDFCDRCEINGLRWMSCLWTQPPKWRPHTSVYSTKTSTRSWVRADCGAG